MGYNNQFKKPIGEVGKTVASYMNKHHKPLASWGLSQIKVLPTNVILDVGCGGGKMVNMLAHKANQGKVFGIDYSGDMVNYARNFNNEFIAKDLVQIREESVEKMSFPDNFFDLVTAVETYYFWPKFADGLTEIIRVLKVNGKVLLINELIKNGSLEIKQAKNLKDRGANLLTFEEIKGAMQIIGFTNVQLFKNRSIWNLLVRRGARFWNVIIAQKPNH